MHLTSWQWYSSNMELSWTVPIQGPEAEERPDRTVDGRIRSWGPFYYGHFSYVDEEGGALTFIGILRTRLGFAW